ncbi:hypothetical protein K438DRAFT_52468 [Mycena galopus ATCC 62051]|nr:hypothetical protein K438DRAFT_52468 [Mycena galopus ATCC 62051]
MRVTVTLTTAPTPPSPSLSSLSFLPSAFTTVEILGHWTLKDSNKTPRMLPVLSITCFGLLQQWIWVWSGSCSSRWPRGSRVGVFLTSNIARFFYAVQFALFKPRI